MHVLCLVEGAAMRVARPTGAFADVEIGYAGVLVVPAAVGAYRLQPLGEAGDELAVLTAFARRTG